MSVANKLTKADDSFNVTIADNGFMIDISGRDAEDEWSGAKVICNSVEELHAAISEILALPRS